MPSERTPYKVEEVEVVRAKVETRSGSEWAKAATEKEIEQEGGQGLLKNNLPILYQCREPVIRVPHLNF